MADPEYDDHQVSGVVLYDANGVAMAVENGVAIPAGTRSQLISGRGTTGGLAQQLRTIPDTDEPTQARLMVQSEFKPGSQVAVVPVAVPGAKLFRQFLKDAGGSDNMIVNGSVTPVPFFVNADPTDDIVLSEVRFVLTSISLDWGGVHFGKGGGTLPNGVLIEITSGGVLTTFGNVTLNEEILMLPVRNDVLLGQGGNRDVIALSIDLGGQLTLDGGSGDNVTVTIRDNLTTGARDINYFKFAAFGSQVPP